jgi:ATP-dependent DNA helicase RecG
MPLLLNVDKLLARIRNLTFRYMPDNSLFPDEITQYDNYVIREALHNCIAHQDYALQERINVVETPDTLTFANGGAFIPKTVEAVITQDAPQRYYRNKFLCAAMVSLNMIDTIGSDIRRMYINQRKRYFPLPDYKISENEVSVKIYGKVINPNYVKLLKYNSDTTLMEIIALDHIQKGYSISDDIAKLLRQKKLIEGRKTNLFLSDTVAMATDEMAQYIQNKAFNKKYYKDLTLELLKKKKLGASKNEIKELVWNKLSNTLSDAQKDIYIKNLLFQMVRDGLISSKERKYFLADF